MNFRSLKFIILSLLILLNCKCSALNSFIDGMGDAINNLGNMMNAIGSNVENVVDGIKILEKVITEAIEENCEFRCANDAKPVPNPLHEPSQNGCGTFGLKWQQKYLPLKQLTRCCDRHDICYDTCNKNKEHCDMTFKTCLYKLCDTYKTTFVEVMTHKKCKAAAKVMYTGTTALGCKAYKDSQAKACLCRKKHDDL